MRKLPVVILMLFISFSLMLPRTANAAISGKTKAFITIVGYGVAGGALLGAASMAFGNSTRAVAQGASLGLYAGILFGGYVLFSHHNKRQGSYEDTGPYKESSDIYGEGYQSDEGGGSGEENSKGGFFDRIQTMQGQFQTDNKKGGRMPPLYMNLLQLEF